MVVDRQSSVGHDRCKYENIVELNVYVYRSERTSNTAQCTCQVTIKEKNIEKRSFRIFVQYFLGLSKRLSIKHDEAKKPWN